jgi:hypothetical protein
MKKIILFFLIFFTISVKPISAIVDPRVTTNNRFGIHALDFSDLEPAANLVNSSGGDWGYVTLVIRQNDQDKAKWQKILDQCRDLKLIPIIRLATVPVKDYWQKPNLDEVNNWVNFLESLNWVIQNRYIVLFNEPNHAKEWENQINPEEYAKTIRVFHQALKKSSPDYFILPAGLDTAAPNSINTMTASDYWSKMYQSDPDIFKLLDGWNSHSYPNPGFSGPVTGSGLGTLKSYQAEVSFLSNYGLPADPPIFITETGWVHKDGKILGASTDNTALSNFYRSAFQSVWIQSNLVAITPFVLNYPQPPFDKFAWQKPNSKEFYPHYYAVKNLTKVAGQPTQIHDSKIISDTIPEKLTESSSYQFDITFKNTGQSIWTQDNAKLVITTNLPQESFSFTPTQTTKPNSNTNYTITIHTPAKTQPVSLKLQLQNENTPFGQQREKTITIVPPPSIVIKASRYFRNDLVPVEYKLLIYDQNQELKNELFISLKNFISQPIKLYNLIPQSSYRFVILKDYYLPRQVSAVLGSDQTTIQFKTLLPLDLNKDGHFSIKDFLYHLTHPLTIFKII